MSVVALYTVGNSELELDSVPLHPVNQRQKGQELDNLFEHYASRLHAPMLEACIRYVLARHPCLDRLVLFGTDQPEAVGEKYRNSDTLYIAQVLAKLAQHCFPPPGRKNPKPGVRETKTRTLKCDASAYDEVYKWFGSALSRLIPGDTYYLCPTAGTPAMTQGLLLQGILHSREHCQVLYVPRGSTEAEERSFATVFLRDLRRERVHQALNSQDFAGACRLLDAQEGWRGPFCRYAACRLRSDFSQARLALDEAIGRADAEDKAKLRAIRDDLLQELKVAIESEFVVKAPALLEELYYNAQVTWDQERYDDFLVRLVRFEEICARYLVEKHLHLPTDEVRQSRKFIQAVEDNGYLLEYSKSQKVDQVPLDYHKMGIPVFLALVRYLAEKGLNKEDQVVVTLEQQSRLGRLYRLLCSLDTLRAWRNNIVHDFQGVSKEAVLQQYRETTGVESEPLEAMSQVLELLSRRADRNPFNEAAALISKAL